jgi:hypothetical protein
VLALERFRSPSMQFQMEFLDQRHTESIIRLQREPRAPAPNMVHTDRTPARYAAWSLVDPVSVSRVLAPWLRLQQGLELFQLCHLVASPLS